MLNLLITIPILGIITAFLGVIFEQGLAIIVSILWQKEIVFSYYGHLTPFLAASAIIEESLKFCAIYFVLKSKMNQRGLRLALVSFLLGLFWGIAEVALIAYAQPQYASSIFNLRSDFFLSAIFIILLHSLTAFTMGLIIAAGTFSKYLFSIRVILLTTFIHLLFNFLVIQQGNFTNTLAEIFFGIIFFVDLVILTFLFKELKTRT